MVWQPSLFLLSIGGLASLQPVTLRLIDQGQARRPSHSLVDAGEQRCGNIQAEHSRSVKVAHELG
jgi:hypothetical protein